jgi:SPP1 family predicted phage head-tail adaptor
MSRSSKFRHKLAIYRPVESGTPDPRGDEQLDFAIFKTVWGSLEPLAGREFQYAQQMHGNVTHKVVMRYVAGIDKTMQIQWNGRTFNLGPPLQIENWEISAYVTEAK